jgi:hypothetical protein
MRNGVLIVPLLKNSNKMETLKNMISEPGLEEKQKQRLEKMLSDEIVELELFNDALIENFSQSFDFCKVYFVYNDQLSDFKPGFSGFLDPISGKTDPSIQLKDEGYFFIKYFKASGITTKPDEVRFFKVADRHFNLLEHPFPDSPDRQTSFKLRLKDLLNLRLNTNDLIKTLVVKLNGNLNRYVLR